MSSKSINPTYHRAERDCNGLFDMTFHLRRCFYIGFGTINDAHIGRNKSPLLFGRSFAALLILGLLAPFAVAQASPTAERRLDVQLGGMFSLANPGIPNGASVLYGRWNYSGGGVYATLDPHRRFGLELGARELSGRYVSERTYLAGPRYFKPYGHYVPYGKVLLGRGTFKFPNSIDALSFTVISFGGGVDYRISSSIYVRGDYEYHRWLGFTDKVHNFPGPLTPQVLSIGVAYHIQ